MAPTASPVRAAADLARGTTTAELDQWFVGRDGRTAHRPADPLAAAQSPEPQTLGGSGWLNTRCPSAGTTMRARASLPRCPACSA